MVLRLLLSRPPSFVTSISSACPFHAYHVAVSLSHSVSQHGTFLSICHSLTFFSFFSTQERLYIIDFNPYGPQCDPVLFSWQELEGAQRRTRGETHPYCVLSFCTLCLTLAPLSSALCLALPSIPSYSLGGREGQCAR